MLDRQNQGPQCTACGSPMKLSAIEPSCTGQDLRTFTCPECKRVQRHLIDCAVTEAWSAPKAKQSVRGTGHPARSNQETSGAIRIRPGM
jgi:hypothetical protein